MHTFTTESFTVFNSMVHEAVRDGLTFKAEYKMNTYTITYTGGF